MVNYREILRLHSLGQSQRTIRSSAHCSDNTVRTVLEVASQKGIQWPLDDDITNADLERMLFPDKYKSACLYIEPGTVKSYAQIRLQTLAENEVSRQ